MLHTHKNKILNYTSFFSVSLFLLMAVLFLFPPFFKIDSSKATSIPSETTLTLATTDLILNFKADNPDGTFAASTPNEFAVTTNNYTGYTLNISASETNNTTGTTNDNTTYSKLINIEHPEDLTNALNSISSSSSPEEFNLNNWGYLPSKLNSTENTLYQPAPDFNGTMLDVTNTANAKDVTTEELIPNTYSITLGLKADYTLSTGTYANTYTLNAVANPVNYTITYNKNSEDEVTDLPNAQSGDTTATSITIPNLTPKRAHYSFLGWCTATPTSDNGVDECSGNDSFGNPAVTYQPNDTIDINQTGANDITLYAMWKIDTFTLTISKGNNISSVTGGGTYKYGEQVTVTATKTTDTTCVGYATPSWSRTVGSSALSTTSGNSIVVTIADNTTIAVASTSSNKAQTITLSRSGGASGITIAGTSYTGSSVSLNCGTYNISGSYSSGYTFSSWSRANGVTVANTGAASTTMTVSGPGTLTLTGKSSTIYIQDVTTATCPTSRTLVYDRRDNKTYYIQKIGSLCWMTSNLNIAGGTTLTSATSNVSSNYRLPSSSTSGWGSDSGAYVYNDSEYGGYYSWKAATAGTGALTTMTTTYDVCPKGWRLPSAANWQNLSNNVGSNSIAAPFYGQLSGFTTNTGVALGSKRHGVDAGTGYYWGNSVTYDSDYSEYYADEVRVRPGSSLIISTTDTFSYGRSVRCVAK